MGIKFLNPIEKGELIKGKIVIWSFMALVKIS
jgi:hypothetical protein